jgi:hypothetical protein
MTLMPTGKIDEIARESNRHETAPRSLVRSPLGATTTVLPGWSETWWRHRPETAPLGSAVRCRTLNATDPTPMLEFLRGLASDRKLRLFAVACCRHVWYMIPDHRSHQAVEMTERFIEGVASEAELNVACQTDMAAQRERSQTGQANNGTYAFVATALAPERNADR